jgi:hypothetical protein
MVRTIAEMVLNENIDARVRVEAGHVLFNAIAG